MRSRSQIIPAILTDSSEVFLERLDFAKTKQSVHIDIIDGRFCPGKLTLPIKDWPVIDLDYSEAHLMVQNPVDYLESLADKGITRAIVHVESDFDHREIQEKAKEVDLLLGFAVNPDTNLHQVQSYLEISSYLQIMGVNPGKTGQTLSETTFSDCQFFKKIPNYRLTLTVDGGVNISNISQLKAVGASYFILTTGLFAEGDPEENFNQLMRLLDER